MTQKVNTTVTTVNATSVSGKVIDGCFALFL